MTVVLTLLVRDEADIIEQNLAFHLASGVDFVIATDHASSDGTTEVLERYEREGALRLLREPDGPFRQREWVTRMARLAATDHGADWVISGDADEFWWPRGGSLAEVLAAIPGRYGQVQSFVRHFVPVPDDGRPFAERMTLRLSPHAPINDPASPWRPFRKVVHRASADAVVTEGSHGVTGAIGPPLRGWYPIEVLHFPMRSEAQLERKGRVWGGAVEKFFGGAEVVAGPGAVYHALAHRAAAAGQSGAYYESLAPAADDVRRGLESGLLTEDHRLRDALAAIEAGAQPAFAPPSAVDDALFAIDAAILCEADVVRARRRIDELEERIGALEAGPAARVERRLRALRSRRRGSTT